MRMLAYKRLVWAVESRPLFKLGTSTKLAFFNAYTYASPQSAGHMADNYNLPPYHRQQHQSQQQSNIGQLSPVLSPPPRSLPPLDSPKPQAPSKSKGIPKGKGAIRAKSGCYTCRIRRKVRTHTHLSLAPAHQVFQKCDEMPDESGSCQTCIRLRLECLGFGAKRPDWMRVSAYRVV
jgi:hypothetical protein